MMTEPSGSTGNVNRNIAIGGLGEFSFLPVHASWEKLMLLGVIDYYKRFDIPAYQIVPDSEHFTVDIPDMSKEWNPLNQPIWQWLDQKWHYDVPSDSKVITNLESLRGNPITELMRSEKNEWEMFAGAGPDVQKEDFRIVSLGTILGIDITLSAALHLELGKGLWRENKNSEWKAWG